MAASRLLSGISAADILPPVLPGGGCGGGVALFRRVGYRAAVRSLKLSINQSVNEMDSTRLGGGEVGGTRCEGVRS